MIDPSYRPREVPVMLKHRLWWRHQMDAFSVSPALCGGNSPVTGESPSQRPVTPSFKIFFDLRLNKRLSKPPIGRWFETPLRSSWRHYNVMFHFNIYEQTHMKDHGILDLAVKVVDCIFVFTKFMITNIAFICYTGEVEVDLWYVAEDNLRFE